MQPPEDFILLILLCSWLPMSQPDAPWDVLDYFCGVGRISQLASKLGFQSAACDIKHHQPDARSESQRKSGRPKRSRFDINGEVGFALPCSIGKFCFLEWENFYQGSAPPQINSITLLDMFLCETIPADAPAALEAEVDGEPGIAGQVRPAIDDAGHCLLDMGGCQRRDKSQIGSNSIWLMALHFSQRS